MSKSSQQKTAILYLHGRGEQPSSPPGDLILKQPWKPILHAPHLTDSWLSLAFDVLVNEVDRWMESAAITIGHSFGGWLLLCAAVQRKERGAAIPETLLLSPILGRAMDPKTGAGFFAPRELQVRRSLGLVKEENGQLLPPDRVSFFHAEEDWQCPTADMPLLASLGYSVKKVPGGHRLDHPVARAAVVSAIGRLWPRPSFATLSSL